MNIAAELKLLLKERPELISDPVAMRGVLSDLKCDTRIKEILVHLLECGISGILKNKPEHVSNELIDRLIADMDCRYGTAANHSMEGIQLWMQVYDIQLGSSFSPENGPADPHKIPDQNFPDMEVNDPSEINPHKNPKKNAKPQQWKKWKDLQNRVRFLFLGGCILIIFCLFFRKHFFTIGAAPSFFITLSYFLIAQAYILKTGLTSSSKKGKKSGLFEDFLMILSVIPMVLVIFFTDADLCNAAPLSGFISFIGSGSCIAHNLGILMLGLSGSQKKKK